MCKIGVYLMCCYPDDEVFLEAVRILQSEGIDFLEVGFPFTDPVADGSVIEGAAFDVLKEHTLEDCLSMFARVRELYRGSLYVMTYSNLVYRYGVDRFSSRIEGCDGIILADLPFEERGMFERALESRDIPLIRFLTPETSKDEIKRVVEGARGFVYFVSVRGTTGGSFDMDEETRDRIAYAKDVSEIDVIVGFGIRGRADIERACAVADGVVIGTAALESLKRGTFRDFIVEIS